MNFVWGGLITTAVLAGISLFFAGFFGEAGKDTWQLLKRKFSTRLPEPIEVDRNYNALGYAPGMCEWVPQTALHNRERAGFIYYLDSDRGTRVFRFPNRDRQIKEFLMVKPK